MASSGPEPSLRYHNKVVIVTGGTKGIGEAIVRVFGKNLRYLCKKCKQCILMPSTKTYMGSCFTHTYGEWRIYDSPQTPPDSVYT